MGSGPIIDVSQQIVKSSVVSPLSRSRTVGSTDARLLSCVEEDIPDFMVAFEGNGCKH